MIVLSVLGNLGADAEVIEKNGKKYTSLRMASTKKRVVMGQRTDETTWVSVLTSYSENLVPYLKKGQGLFVTGEADIKTYTSREGKTGVDISLFASSLALAGGTKEATQGNANTQVDNNTTQQGTTQYTQPNQQDLPF